MQYLCGQTTAVPSLYFFFPGRCVSADAAAIFAAGRDFGFARTLLADDAAFTEVTSPFFEGTHISFLNAVASRAIVYYISYARTRRKNALHDI